jgi:flagellar M-ring protein FliF
MEIKSFLSSLSRPARIRLFVGIVLILAITAALLWWVLAPRQQLLFGNLKESDAAEIVASLDEWKIPHKIINGGAGIMVPAEVVYDTRMKLVSAGVPRGGHVGFELFDDSDFGVTEFAQRVNYQRALQGEIERTITSLPGVETARVHLTIRRPGLFVGEHEQSKASVALSLRPGQSLSRQQINGVRSLVAAAVEGLSPDQVSVLGSDGTLLADASTVADGQSIDTDERGTEEVRQEELIRGRVSAMLKQVLHDRDFTISVNVVLNFDTIHEVNERPLPQGDDGNGLLARRRVNSADVADGNGRNQNQEESEFLHGTAREEISRAPGRIERMSIAVILPPWLDEHEVARINSLVAAAAGIDNERGDRLEVSRLGRSHPSPSNPAAIAVRTSTPDTYAAKAISTPWLLGDWRKWALIAVGGSLVGMILALSTQRRVRRLKPEERDAALAKLRGWLAEEEGALP